MDQFFASIPKVIIGPIVVALVILYFVYDDPPKTVCDLQFEIFQKENLNYLYGHTKRAVKHSPKYQKELSLCQEQNSPGACFDWMEGIKKNAALQSQYSQRVQCGSLKRLAQAQTVDGGRRSHGAVQAVDDDLDVHVQSDFMERRTQCATWDLWVVGSRGFDDLLSIEERIHSLVRPRGLRAVAKQFARPIDKIKKAASQRCLGANGAFLQLSALPSVSSYIESSCRFFQPLLPFSPIKRKFGSCLFTIKSLSKKPLPLLSINHSDGSKPNCVSI